MGVVGGVPDVDREDDDEEEIEDVVGAETEVLREWERAWEGLRVA